MSRLQIFADSDPGTTLLDTGDARAIAEALAPVGVRFERWATRAVPEGADLLEVYREEIAQLQAAAGYRSVDVVAMHPHHPDREALRAKFLEEHVHAEDEVRFFVEGEGLFTLHTHGRVFAMLCTQGDLIAVPAGMPHWFDMGPRPHFAAIRLFINPDGWIANFTGDDIARRFPRHEPA